MDELVIVRPEKCIGCNACIRYCKAPEANITHTTEDGRDVITVDPTKCIACGECVRECVHDARDYVDDTNEAMRNLGTQQMIVIVAPAIKSVFRNNWKNVLNWFRSQGCLIYDVSFGADICTWAHMRAIKDHRVGNIITQPCAAIVKYIELYKPELLKNLSPIHSPMLCEVVYIKKYLRRDAPILALSPCIAKKNEFVETGLVEYNVTYQKLKEWFQKNGVQIQNDYDDSFDYKFDGEQGQLGSIYPRIGGLRDNIWAHDPNISVMTAEGVQKVYRELDNYANLPEYKQPEVFDVLSCEYGCCSGAGTGVKKPDGFSITEVMRKAEKDFKKKIKTTGGFFRGAEDKRFKAFDDTLDVDDFMRTYKAGVPSKTPSDEELDPIFKSMGKYEKHERENNCGACGHETCRRMAIAIYRGITTPDKCVMFAHNELKAHHSEITLRNEKLVEITSRCTALSDNMRSDMANIRKSLSEINNANGSTNTKADAVHDLLENVISYCIHNSSMNKEETLQLIDILKTTSEAFDTLYDSVRASTTSAENISGCISEVNDMIEDLNKTLNELE